MPIKRRLCNEAKRSSRHIVNNGLWITDDILDDAFNRFLRFSSGAKRYGSNVPGPLEAQKRLAKRRMMGLVGVGGPPIVHPGLLFGARGPEMGKVVWQAPKSRQTAKNDIASPQAAAAQNKASASWFGGSGLRTREGRSPSLDADWEEQGESTGAVREIYSRETTQDVWLKIRKELATTPISSMPALADVAEDQGIDRIEFCERAFRSVLWQRDMNWEHVLEFLLNPELNPPEARHLTYLISELGARLLSPAEFTAVRKLVHGCLKLGLVSDEEMPELMRAAFVSVGKVSRNIANLDEEMDAPNAPYSLIHAIWTGLRACPIKRDLAETARLMIDLLPRGKSLQALKLELYKCVLPLDHNSRSDSPIEIYLVAWLERACNAASVDPITIPELAHIVKDLYPTVIKQRTLVATTELLLRKRSMQGIDETHRWDVLLNGWVNCLHMALACRVWFPIFDCLAREGVSPLDVADSLARVTPRHMVCEALLLHWLPAMPASQTLKALKADSLVYDETGQVQQEANYSRTVAMRKVVSDYRLLHQEGRSPHAYDAFAFLLIALYRHGQSTLVNNQMIVALAEQMFGVAGLAEICDHARSSGVYLFPQPVSEVMHRIVREQPRVALSLWKSRKIAIQDMDDFLCAMIGDGIHSLEIFRILSFENPDHFQPVAQRSMAYQRLSERRINLIHVCADAFSRRSRSREESLRTTFRNVHLCYRYLVARLAPMDGRMSRALVRAGITNYLQEGVAVSKTQIKFVLEKVEQMEGPEIAQELEELVTRWTDKVYREWNRRGLPRRREMQTQRTPVRLRRSITTGLLRHRTPFDWQREAAQIARRIRYYLDDGTHRYTDIDVIFRKKMVRYGRAMRRELKISPPFRKLKISEESQETWTEAGTPDLPSAKSEKGTFETWQPQF